MTLQGDYIEYSSSGQPVNTQFVFFLEIPYGVLRFVPENTVSCTCQEAQVDQRLELQHAVISSGALLTRHSSFRQNSLSWKYYTA